MQEESSKAYLASLPGKRGSEISTGGGGISYARLHILTCASPCLAAVSDLLSPWRAPYILSFRRHVFVTGIQLRSSSSKTKFNVLIALFRTLV
uniref:Uncharacterized protein n=1 Tax=Schistosoma japonicum TaxID=6182 RepID=Q5C1D1_SCHJA|nr:unknown [Schistosoma japonicum]